MPRQPKVEMVILQVRTKDGEHYMFSYRYGQETNNWIRYVRSTGQIVYPKTPVLTARGTVMKQAMNPARGYTKRLISVLEKHLKHGSVSSAVIEVTCPNCKGRLKSVHDEGYDWQCEKCEYRYSDDQLNAEQEVNK